MKILVTGGAGYLGCVLITQLLTAGHQVCCLDLRSSEFMGYVKLKEEQIQRLRLITGDIRDELLLKESFKGVDAVVHLAAIVGYPVCDASPHLAQDINISGTEIISKYVRPGTPFIFLSSYTVYGGCTESVCSEKQSISPSTLYSQTKAAGEKLVLAKHGVVFRPTTAFGRSQRMRLDLMPHKMAYAGLTKERLRLFGPHDVRPLIHVFDLANAINFALNNFSNMHGEIFNIGSDAATMTKLDLVNKISGLTGLSTVVDVSVNDPERRNFRVSYEKLYAAGYQVETNFDDQLKDTIEWLSDHVAEAYCQRQKAA